MLSLNKNLKFTLTYYKYIKNNSILSLNNNTKIKIPITLKTNKNKNMLYFEYNKTNSVMQDDLKFYILKKNYIKILLNTFYSIDNDYSSILLLVDKNKDGYKIINKDNLLIFKLGKSHDILYNIPSNFKFKLGRKAKSIKVKSSSLKIMVDFILNLRKHRMPEPYKGKGLLFKNEDIKRKKIKKLRSIKNFKKKRKK